VISIFAGAQLFTIGIIGEYLSRMHFRTMGRPYAIIRDTAGNFSHGKGNPSS
jgi:undecaprenyl-phosphate 4-deoxy-4-formamido-L-arabinose transferase